MSHENLILLALREIAVALRKGLADGNKDAVVAITLNIERQLAQALGPRPKPKAKPQSPDLDYKAMQRETERIQREVYGMHQKGNGQLKDF